jgi:hypothetical protein
MNCVSMNVTLSNIEWNISQWTLIQTNIGQYWMKHEQTERYHYVSEQFICIGRMIYNCQSTSDMNL